MDTQSASPQRLKYDRKGRTAIEDVFTFDLREILLVWREIEYRSGRGAMKAIPSRQTREQRRTSLNAIKELEHEASIAFGGQVRFPGTNRPTAEFRTEYIRGDCLLCGERKRLRNELCRPCWKRKHEEGIRLFSIPTCHSRFGDSEMPLGRYGPHDDTSPGWDNIVRSLEEDR